MKEGTDVLAGVSRRLIDQAYSPFHAVLRCGNLSSDVQVFPRPEPVIVDEEVDPMPRTVQTGTGGSGFFDDRKRRSVVVKSNTSGFIHFNTGYTHWVFRA